MTASSSVASRDLSQTLVSGLGAEPIEVTDGGATDSVVDDHDLVFSGSRG